MSSRRSGPRAQRRVFLDHAIPPTMRRLTGRRAKRPSRRCRHFRFAFPTASPLYVASAGALTLDHASVVRGSNEFTAGAAQTTTHRALLANDPHLELRDARRLVARRSRSARLLHVAGATLAGRARHHPRSQRACGVGRHQRHGRNGRNLSRTLQIGHVRRISCGRPVRCSSAEHRGTKSFGVRFGKRGARANFYERDTVSCSRTDGNDRNSRRPGPPT